MSERKTIADRFDEYTFEVDQSMFHETEIINWLKLQPENQCFTLQEVEAIARYFYGCGKWDGDFDTEWAKKAKGLE